MYGAEQLNNAKTKREQEVRQLEARLGGSPQFSKASDGLSFALPIKPRKRNELPVSLQAIGTIKLIVLNLYNLGPYRIEPQGVYGEDVRNLQDALRIRALENTGLSLIAHVSYPSQNMHVMAASAAKEKAPAIAMSKEPVEKVAPRVREFGPLQLL